MSELKREQYYSPMECIYESYDVPKSEKRKSEVDSGYVSLYSSLGFSQTQFGSCSSDERSQSGFRKKLFSESQDESTSSTLPGVSTYSDFLRDASLYKPSETPTEFKDELMQVDSMISCKEESLPSMEICKDIETISQSSSQFFTPPSSTVSKVMKNKLYRTKSLVGFEHVNFFSKLGVEANHQHIISRILENLSDKDISSLTIVSKTVKNVVLADPKAKSRWLNYTKDRKSKKENLWVQRKLFKSTLEPLQIRNHSTPLLPKQNSSPPVSPSKERFWMFHKEGKRLKEDEMLSPCPRCTRPAVCNKSLKTGKCSSDVCRYEFCCLCRCAEHSANISCSTVGSTTPTKTRSLSFKQRKARLRRLLL